MAWRRAPRRCRRPRRRRPHRLRRPHRRHHHRHHHRHHLPAATGAATAAAPLTEDEIFSRKTVDELNAERPLADVMFDYDKATLRDEQRAVLQKGAEFLRLRTSVRVTIEGHADSRGTNEYNLALGERRANAAREYLVGLGIAADRLMVVSKGEEAPVCTEETEACCSRNRRGHFIITAK